MNKNKKTFNNKINNSKLKIDNSQRKHLTSEQKDELLDLYEAVLDKMFDENENIDFKDKKRK